MPSFKPSRAYLLKLTGELIDAHEVRGPFLEIGCGDGAISAELARRGWSGVAMDLSHESERTTKELLAREGVLDRVQVRRDDFLDCNFAEKFQTIILYDVLEHVAADRIFLNKIRGSLDEGGHLFLSVPVKMREWRWDDDGYGHLRRYEAEELRELLNSPASGFEKLAQWDITFPVLWAMRRIYLFLASPPAAVKSASIEQRTEQSAFVNAGGESCAVRIVESLPIWPLVFWIQDRFRTRDFGCNTLILARAVPIADRAASTGVQPPAQIAC